MDGRRDRFGRQARHIPGRHVKAAGAGHDLAVDPPPRRTILRSVPPPKIETKDYYDHIYIIVKFCTHMGLPVDYWEVDNEPEAGPYEGVKGYSLHVTWQEYLDYWDTVYSAIRAANRMR